MRRNFGDDRGTTFALTLRMHRNHLVVLMCSGVCSLAACATEPTDIAADEGTGTDIEALSARYGVDYSFTRPSPTTLNAQGYTFAARYLSDVSEKNLSHAEASALIAAGLDVVSTWEQAADDALGGYTRGRADAETANAQNAADGAPSARPIYFGIDFDATEGQQAVINSYFDGVASVIGRDRTGAYGGYDPIRRLFDAGKIKWGWQTYAWSGGQWDPRAQLRQVQNGIANGQEDEDQAVVADFGQWGHTTIETGPSPKAPPVPTGCGVIAPGHGLSRGQAWGSCEGRFRLTMQADGNLVVYSSGVATWATYTNTGAIVVMQTDGNFVLYDHHSQALWNSQTGGHAGARLAIQTDGNVVVYSGATALWDSATGAMPAAPTGCGEIAPGHGLAIGEALRSCDKRFTLVQQGDGNLVLYGGSTALWNANTYHLGGKRLVMQTDGDLVTYGAAAVWNSHTSNHPGAHLALQDDGNAVIYDGVTALWSTHTGGH